MVSISLQSEDESEAKSNATGTLITTRLSVKTADRIGSSVGCRARRALDASISATSQPVNLRLDLSAQNFVEDGGQRLRVGIVGRVNVNRRDGVGHSVLTCSQTGHRILVEGI